MKKLFVLFAAAALLCGAVACGNTENKEGEAAAEPACTECAADSCQACTQCDSCQNCCCADSTCCNK